MTLPEKGSWTACLQAEGIRGVSASQFGAALGLAGCVSDYVHYQKYVVGTHQEFRGNEMTAHGIDTEPLAKLVYEILTETAVEDGGFFVEAGPFCGPDLARLGRLAASPDGIVSWRNRRPGEVPTMCVQAPTLANSADDGQGQMGNTSVKSLRQLAAIEESANPVKRVPHRLLEIKSPFKLFYSGSREKNRPFGIPQTYMVQMQGQMSISGADECDFFVFLRYPEAACCGFRVYRSPEFWSWARPKLLQVSSFLSMSDEAYKAATDPDNGTLNRSLKFDPFFDFSLIRVEPLIPPINLITGASLIDWTTFPFFAERMNALPPTPKAVGSSALLRLLLRERLQRGDVVQLCVRRFSTPSTHFSGDTASKRQASAAEPLAASTVHVIDTNSDADSDVCVLATPVPVRRLRRRGRLPSLAGRGSVADGDDRLTSATVTFAGVGARPNALEVTAADATASGISSARRYDEVLRLVTDGPMQLLDSPSWHPTRHGETHGSYRCSHHRTEPRMDTDDRSQQQTQSSCCSVIEVDEDRHCLSGTRAESARDRVNTSLSQHANYEPTVSTTSLIRLCQSASLQLDETHEPLMLDPTRCHVIIKRGPRLPVFVSSEDKQVSHEPPSLFPRFAPVLVVPPSDVFATPLAILRFAAVPSTATRHHRYWRVRSNAVRTRSTPIGAMVLLEKAGEHTPLVAESSTTGPVETAVVSTRRIVNLGWDLITLSRQQTTGNDGRSAAKELATILRTAAVVITRQSSSDNGTKRRWTLLHPQPRARTRLTANNNSTLMPSAPAVVHFPSAVDAVRMLEDRVWLPQQQQQQPCSEGELQLAFEPDTAITRFQSCLSADLLPAADSEDKGEPPVRDEAVEAALGARVWVIGAGLSASAQAGDREREDVPTTVGDSMTPLMETFRQFWERAWQVRSRCLRVGCSAQPPLLVALVD